jgi:hypothetical protein
MIRRSWWNDGDPKLTILLYRGSFETAFRSLNKDSKLSGIDRRSDNDIVMMTFHFILKRSSNKVKQESSVTLRR